MAGSLDLGERSFDSDRLRPDVESIMGSFGPQLHNAFFARLDHAMPRHGSKIITSLNTLFHQVVHQVCAIVELGQIISLHLPRAPVPLIKAYLKSYRGVVSSLKNLKKFRMRQGVLVRVYRAPL